MPVARAISLIPRRALAERYPEHGQRRPHPRLPWSKCSLIPNAAAKVRGRGIKEPTDSERGNQLQKTGELLRSTLIIKKALKRETARNENIRLRKHLNAGQAHENLSSAGLEKTDARALPLAFECKQY